MQMLIIWMYSIKNYQFLLQIEQCDHLSKENS